MTSDQQTDSTETASRNPAHVPLGDLAAVWPRVTAWLDRIRQLPSTQEEFTNRYGAFHDEESLSVFLYALVQAGILGHMLGTPADIRKRIAEDPDYLIGPRMPDECYGAVIWLAGRAGSRAGTIGITYDSLPMILDPGNGTPEQRAKALREILTSKGGIGPEADRTAGEAEQIRLRLEAVRDELAHCIGELHEHSPLPEAYRTIGGRPGEEEVARKEALIRDLREVHTTAHLVASALTRAGSVIERQRDVCANVPTVVTAVCRAGDDTQLSRHVWVGDILGSLMGNGSQWKAAQKAADDFVQRALVS
ncbi:hypothetical protein ACFY2W_32795 [Streptomyces sp. NPDC001262]|uniref:hypothetical protein n=1 Tax=Streptomyces sp. NPDC001262 TaxID=3364552 RepID=UPI0036A35B00